MRSQLLTSVIIQISAPNCIESQIQIYVCTWAWGVSPKKSDEVTFSQRILLDKS